MFEKIFFIILDKHNIFNFIILKTINVLNRIRYKEHEQ